MSLVFSKIIARSPQLHIFVQNTHSDIFHTNFLPQRTHTSHFLHSFHTAYPHNSLTPPDKGNSLNVISYKAFDTLHPDRSLSHTIHLTQPITKNSITRPHSHNLSDRAPICVAAAPKSAVDSAFCVAGAALTKFGCCPWSTVSAGSRTLLRRK